MAIKYSNSGIAEVKLFSNLTEATDFISKRDSARMDEIEKQTILWGTKFKHDITQRVVLEGRH